MHVWRQLGSKSTAKRLEGYLAVSLLPGYLPHMSYTLFGYGVPTGYTYVVPKDNLLSVGAVARSMRVETLHTFATCASMDIMAPAISTKIAEDRTSLSVSSKHEILTCAVCNARFDIRCSDSRYFYNTPRIPLPENFVKTVVNVIAAFYENVDRNSVDTNSQQFTVIKKFLQIQKLEVAVKSTARFIATIRGWDSVWQLIDPSLRSPVVRLARSVRPPLSLATPAWPWRVPTCSVHATDVFVAALRDIVHHALVAKRSSILNHLLTILGFLHLYWETYVDSVRSRYSPAQYSGSIVRGTYEETAAIFRRAVNTGILTVMENSPPDAQMPPVLEDFFALVMANCLCGA